MTTRLEDITTAQAMLEALGQSAKDIRTKIETDPSSGATYEDRKALTADIQIEVGKFLRFVREKFGADEAILATGTESEKAALKADVKGIFQNPLGSLEELAEQRDAVIAITFAKTMLSFHRVQVDALRCPEFSDFANTYREPIL